MHKSLVLLITFIYLYMYYIFYLFISPSTVSFFVEATESAFNSRSHCTKSSIRIDRSWSLWWERSLLWQRWRWSQFEDGVVPNDATSYRTWLAQNLLFTADEDNNTNNRTVPIYYTLTATATTDAVNGSSHDKNNLFECLPVLPYS